MSFGEWLSSSRMDYVVSELAHSDRKIKEIILESGYLDVSNFTRKFREKYGITPKEYRSCYFRDNN